MGKIHINPAHKGELHRELGVAQGKPIPEAKLEAAKHSGNPAEVKRAVFAENAKHFDHSHHVAKEISHHETHGHGS